MGYFEWAFQTHHPNQLFLLADTQYNGQCRKLIHNLLVYRTTNPLSPPFSTMLYLLESRKRSPELFTNWLVTVALNVCYEKIVINSNNSFYLGFSKIWHQIRLCFLYLYSHSKLCLLRKGEGIRLMYNAAGFLYSSRYKMVIAYFIMNILGSEIWSELLPN